MSLFDPVDDLPEVDVSDQKLAHLLVEIKRNSRNRRIAMVAPVALAVAVLATLIAAPPRYGGLALVPEADADNNSAELPRVFGSNGVWRLAEPIAETPQGNPGPAAVVEVPTEPEAPAFVLSPPDQEELQSLPASTSTPPMSTPGQALEDTPADVLAAPGDGEAAGDDVDLSSFAAVIRIEPHETEAALETPADVETGNQSSSPDPSAPAEGTTTPDSSSSDEDVTVAVAPQTESSGVDAGDQLEANPSTPPAGPADPGMQRYSEAASIVPRSVLVYSAHVSVMVQVVDDDSSVIDWCNTRVDWGDGSVTGVANTGGVATCTAPCELEATPSDVGINRAVEFTHEYTQVIDAAPRIYVATGDGCNYTLAELQLSPFTVVPY